MWLDVKISSCISLIWINLFVNYILIKLGKPPNSIVFSITVHWLPKERYAKECSNYGTIALISHASKIMLKIFQDLGFNSMWNWELPDVQAGFRKGRGTKDQISNIRWITQKKQENSRKASTSASLTMLKPLTMWITTDCGKFFKRWEYQTTLPDSWETCMQVKKQQNWTWSNGLVPNWERSRSRLYIVTALV